jgi:uncharacterized membrane protein
MLFSAILAFHIACGTAGLLSGAAAISVRKGSRAHRVIGNVFVLTMLGLAASAVYLATVKHQMPNILGGIFTAYLVTTAWLSARRRDKETDLRDWAGLLVVLVLVAVYFTSGWEAAHSPTGAKDGYRPGLYLVAGTLALLAAAGDVRLLIRGGILGRQRLARHIWRMCYGLFVASGSIFLARPHLFPVLLRKTGVLMLLGVFPLVAMVFWLIKIRAGRTYKRVTEQAGCLRAVAFRQTSLNMTV